MTDATAAAAQDTTAATATTAQSDTTLLTSGTDATTTTTTATDATTTTDATKQEGDQTAKDKTATDDADKAKDDGKDKPQGAPEAYADFTLPEGMDMDAEVLGEFKEFAKELNLPQDKAQKIVDFQTKLATKQAEEYQAAVTKQKEDWAAAVKNDPELGGEKYEKSVESAVKVIQAFGDEGLKNLLNTTGLGNNPALFKFCHRVSQAISEDKFVLPGNQQDAPKEMSIIDAFK
ncbi:MAG: peptidase [Gammaproteobacteria bacterium]|nr:peptidase [Gammaproteobacteria bacterium]MBU0821881.1 peptidase [Gammaproteobacteria bacterium]MBU0843994.1 peptidase [Gammaproteobacteria bacterium]MBU1842245.1 peptidase [Gammaproteobacteria bacterium]